jgi:hypothetical protein
MMMIVNEREKTITKEDPDDNERRENTKFLFLLERKSGDLSLFSLRESN